MEARVDAGEGLEEEAVASGGEGDPRTGEGGSDEGGAMETAMPMETRAAPRALR